MDRWLSLDDDRKRRAYARIAEETGMSSFAVEKDWWVVQTLSVVFDIDVSAHMVFKGGTSLSKAWGLIERFSEDVDLAIDREYFGYKGELSRKQVTELRKAANAFTSRAFFEELKRRFSERGLVGVELHMGETESSDQDPRVIDVYYPNLIPSPGYMKAKVQIEVGCRSLRDPFTHRDVHSLVDQAFPGMTFSGPSVSVPSVNPERTFLEKIFLLHEEFQRPVDKVRVDRLSRHIYDVVKLSGSEFAAKALADMDLYVTIVRHRYRFARVGGVDYKTHQPHSIDPLPVKHISDAWRQDYNTMVEQMIYEKAPPTYDQAIGLLAELKARINALSWRFEL